MGLLSDLQISFHVRNRQMILPFVDHMVQGGVVSFGLSSYGYDARCSDTYKIFTNVNSAIVDPKNMPASSMIDFTGDVCIIPPNSFVLATTVERFKIPREMLAICVGKSTYARCGIVTPITPLEPEWEGQVTLEIANTTPLPAKVYSGEGIIQVLFFTADSVCQQSYKDRLGKYHKQAGITLSKV